MFLNLSLNLNYADLVIGLLSSLVSSKAFWPVSVIRPQRGRNVRELMGAYFLTNPVVNYPSVGGWNRVPDGIDVFSLIPATPSRRSQCGSRVFRGYRFHSVAQAYFSPHQGSFPGNRGCCRSRRHVGFHPVILDGPDPCGRGGVLHASGVAQGNMGPDIQDLCLCHFLVGAHKDPRGLAPRGPVTCMVIIDCRGPVPSGGIGDLGSGTDVIASSHLVGILLGIYQVLIPAVLLRIGG